MANPGYGQRLIAARQALGLSQDALAALLDCTQVSVCRYESEKRCPSGARWKALCAALRAEEFDLRYGGVAPVIRTSVRVNIYDVPAEQVTEISQDEYNRLKLAKRSR